MKANTLNFLKKACAFVVSATFVVGMLKAGKVFADPACSLSKSGSAEVGKTISINVGVSGDGPYGGFNGSVSYDSAYFEMVGISAGGYGAANFSKSGSSFLDYNCNIPSGATIAVIQLKCLQEGTSSVSVSLNVSSLDGTADFSTGSSASITISAPVVLSGNANLSALSVAPGTLSPSFSKGTTNYHVTVPESQTSIAVTATAEDPKAKVSLNGVQKSLEPGDNTVKVSVTAENGDVKTYKILVTRGAPTPTPEPYPVIVTGENSYTILEPETLETIPTGFAWSTTTYNSKIVPCLAGPTGTLMMWLLSDSGSGLYIYDLDTQTVAPCYAYTNEAVSMMILPIPSDFVIPTGYEKSTYMYQEHEVDVLKNTEHPELPSLIYLMDETCTESMFYLDEASGMILPFRGDISELIATPTPIPTDTPTPSPTPTPTTAPVATEASDEGASGGNRYKLATYVLAGICCLLLVAFVILLVMRMKDRNDMNDAYIQEEAEEEPEEADNEPETEEVSSENEGDHYYQFGDEEPEMRRPGAKRAGEDLDKPAEVKKEEPLPDFPEFPEKKPEPVIEQSVPSPMITVIDTESASSEEDSDNENKSDDEGENKNEDNDGEV
ncbi:MAG: cadherin-like beta sandwich domain-containing protein [Clostridiales bacterium]|nr:cadherin-like beta sandwich domain-containing protein [Clostridiales bacterium]